MRVTLGKDYSVEKCDQTSYQFVYEEYPHFNKIVHGDDWEAVRGYLEESSEGEFVVARLLRSDGVYRMCMLTVIDRNVKVRDRVCMDVEIRDLVSMTHRYDLNLINVMKYRAFIAMIPERLFEYDVESGDFFIYKYKGQRCEMIVKGPIDEVCQKGIEKARTNGEDYETLQEFYRNIKSCRENFTTEIETSVLPGTIKKETLSLHGQLLKNNNKPVKVVGLISAISRLGDSKQKPVDYDMVDKDSATGLFNKKAMTDYVASRINHLRDKGVDEGFWLIICDIDYFKHVNDTYGHLFGDEVIYRFAQTLKDWFGDRGIVGRIGGDEFMVMTTGPAMELSELRSILIGMRKELEWAFQDKVKEYRFTTSIGVARYPDNATDYEKLFRTADRALYIAKEKGRNRFITYNPELHGDVDEADATGSYLNKTEMKPMAKVDMVANLIYLLAQHGSDVVQSILAELVDHLNIHGTTVYVADDSGRLTARWTGGKYDISVDDLGDYVDGDYYGLFDENGILVCNNVESFEGKCDSMYGFWKERGIISTLQYMVGAKDDVVALITFDIFGEHRRKWSESDVEMLYLLIKFMGNVLES
jgi:diguanylate cyclase (GGDEF)-like protein